MTWRDDPAWRLVEYDPAYYAQVELPEKPTAEAELATAPCWASLYHEHKLIATWHREPRRYVLPS